MIKLLCIMACVILSACSVNPSTRADNEEILNKLGEMSKQINTLSDDVDVIKQGLSTVLRGAPEAHKPPVITEIELDDASPVRGDGNAMVAIVEFSDYQCPFCGRFHAQVLPSVKKSYIDTGKIRHIFRDFPLDFHPQAKSAAIAANCAGEQKAYWQMHDSLFSNQNRLGTALYEELAKKMNINMASFQACLKDAKQAEKVEKDLSYGQSLGIDGTPNFFVGRIEGKKLVDVKQIVGAQPPAVFYQAIEAVLGGAPQN
ncbi:MAG: DsbA family protein [Gammaproteobacteria bacterium]|nr:DsbA family protein [Gammaproteobacteria bacterium]